MDTMEFLRSQTKESAEKFDAVRYQNDGPYAAKLESIWKEKMRETIDQDLALIEEQYKQDDHVDQDPNMLSRAQFLTATSVSIFRLLHLAEKAGYLANGVTSSYLGATKSTIKWAGRILSLASEPTFYM